MPTVHRPAAFGVALLLLCAACTETDNLKSAASGLVAGGVLVNECMSGTSGYVELINAGTAAADLSRDPTYCYSVDDIPGGGSPKQITDLNVNHAAGSATCANAGRPATCALLAPGERVWVPYSYVNSASADACRLLKHVYATGGNGCSGFYEDQDPGGPTASTAAGQCFGRQPDATSWQTAAIPCSPSGGSNGGGASCTAGAPCDDANLCTSGETWSSACACTGGTAVGCDDGNPCTADSCAAATGCAHAALGDGTACSGGACEAGECVGAVLMPVVINEFYAGSAGWVEFYNPRTTDADLGGYQIDDVAAAGGAPITLPGGTMVPARGYRVFAYGSFNTASKDDVRLVAANCGACSAGPGDSTGNFYAGTSISGKCFGRQPDGGAWAAANLACSQGLTNGGGAACTPGSPCDDGNVCTTGETLSSSCACTGGAALNCDDGNACTADTCTAPAGCAHTAAADGAACGAGGVCQAGVCATSEPPVVINQFLAGTAGWVELYNPRNTEASLAGYIIDDVAGGGTAPLAIADDQRIGAHGFRWYAYGGINTASKDEVRLAPATCGASCGAGPGDAHSNFYVSASIAGKCFGRLPDGGSWASDAQTCSQGFSNGGCTAGETCDDGNACTTNDRWTAICQCVGTSLSCDDSNSCTADGCTPSTGCSHTPKPDGTSCGTDRACQGGVCAPPATTTCTATGGTYKTISFTQAEECRALDLLNKARYSKLASGLTTTAARVGYDCGPDGTCGYRRAAWTSLAQYANYGTGGSCTIGASSLTALKTLAASWSGTDDGVHGDTVANTADTTNINAVTYDRVYIERGFTSGSLICAVARDAPGAAASVNVCNSMLNEGYTDPGRYAGSYVWVRGTRNGSVVNLSTSMSCGAFAPFGSAIEPANPNPL